MTMPLSTYAGNAILDAMLNNTSFAVATPYVSLHSGDPGLTGASEIVGNGYTRILGSFSAAATQASANDAMVTFPTASADWAAATYLGVWDAATVGNFLGGAALDVSRTILSGEYGEFAVSALDITGATAFGDATLDDIIDAIFNNAALVVTQAYASLHTGAVGGTGANEQPNLESYARVALNFDAAGSKACVNTSETDFAAAGGDGWASSTDLGLWTLGTYGAGVFLWGKALTVARTVGLGKVFRIAAGGVSVEVT